MTFEFHFGDGTWKILSVVVSDGRTPSVSLTHVYRDGESSLYHLRQVTVKWSLSCDTVAKCNSVTLVNCVTRVSSVTLLCDCW